MNLIFNASPVIVLAKAGLLDRLLGVGSKVCIPQPVAEEIARVNDPKDRARNWILDPANRNFICPRPEILSLVAGWDLGLGESAVLSMAKIMPRMTAVLDDLAARRCAQSLEVPMIGTIGLLLMAKKQGILPEVGAALDAVCAAGLFIAPKHLTAVREAAGE